MKYKRFLFIQLPLSDHGYNYVDGNVQYAPAALSAFLKNKYDSEVAYIPEYFINYASDYSIIEYIIRYNPDCLCFTLFLWNCERALNICKKIKDKKIQKDIVIIAGGAEVHADSWLLSKTRDEFDIFVKAEGEFFFDNFLNGNIDNYSMRINGNLLFVQPENQAINFKECPEPFIANYLNVLHDKSVFYEYMRGCPYRCVYCNYSGHASLVREKGEEHLLRFIKTACERDVKEIYILAPSLERSRNFEQLLEKISTINTNEIRLHSELRTEYIDQNRAALLYKAGFRSLEIGLQTITENSLKAIGRKTDIDKMFEGIDYLIKAGIELKMGVIPGLPGDSPDEFKRMIDLLTQKGYSEIIEFYPLMVLPGTKLRSLIKKFGIEFQSKPPYHLTANDNFETGSISDIKEYLEDKTGIYALSHTVPDLICDSKSLLYKGAFLDLSENNSFLNIRKDSYHFTYFIKFNNVQDLYEIFPELIKDDSYLYSFVIFNESLISEEYLITVIESVFKDTFTERLNLYNEWVDTLSVRVFQLFFDYDSYINADKNYNYIEPFYFTNDVNDNDNSVVITENFYNSCKNEIANNYGEYTEKISFTDINNFNDFYSSIGEYKKCPPFNIYNYNKLSGLWKYNR